MKSADMAQLCGVTVRTLRHYHRLGLLPEPARLRNGYRSYDGTHVARLLRIRSLAEAGVPLAQIAGLLDGTEQPSALLHQTEQDLTARIAELREQRDLLRSLTTTAHDESFSGLPSTLATSLSGPESEAPASWSVFDVDLALMLHLTTPGVERKRVMHEVYRRAARAAATPAFRDLQRRFRMLTRGAVPEEIDAIVESTFRAIDGLGDTTDFTLSRSQQRAVDVLVAIGPFNGPQRTVLRRLLLTATQVSAEH